MNKMYSKYKKQGLLIIGLSVDRDIEDARSFLSWTGTKHPAYLADDGIMDAYRLEFVPYLVYIDRNGEARYREVGFHEDKKGEIEKKIVELLKEGS